MHTGVCWGFGGGGVAQKFRGSTEESEVVCDVCSQAAAAAASASTAESRALSRLGVTKRWLPALTDIIITELLKIGEYIH